MNQAVQLKCCECCGKNFLRPIPKTAPDGEKICQNCIENPPREDEDEDVCPPDHSYRVIGVKFR